MLIINNKYYQKKYDFFGPLGLVFCPYGEGGGCRLKEAVHWLALVPGTSAAIQGAKGDLLVS